MKKVLSLILASLMSFCLVACSNTKTSTSKTVEVGKTSIELPANWDYETAYQEADQSEIDFKDSTSEEFFVVTIVNGISKENFDLELSSVADIYQQYELGDMYGITGEAEIEKNGVTSNSKIYQVYKVSDSAVYILQFVCSETVMNNFLDQLSK